MNFLKMYVQCISKEFEKIRNDGERCFENKKVWIIMKPFHMSSK
jgi:hypothetical protein